MELYLHSPICLRGVHKGNLTLPYNLSLFVKDEPFNPLNAELNPICHLLTLLGAHHILHVSRLRVKQCFDRRKKARVIEKERNKGKEMGENENEKDQERYT
jgi:hypothetical protein